MGKRIITTELTTEDTQIEYSLRPRYLSEYTGQEKLKETLSIYIKAAKQQVLPKNCKPLP